MTNKMVKSKASQASTEFVFLVIVAFMVALTFTVVSLNRQKEIDFQKEYSLLKDVGLMVQGEILLAANVENGYSRRFSVPDKIDVFNYSISLYNSTYLVLESKSHLFAVRVPSVNGSIVKGANLIEKDEGIIKIN